MKVYLVQQIFNVCIDTEYGDTEIFYYPVKIFANQKDAEKFRGEILEFLKVPEINCDDLCGQMKRGYRFTLSKKDPNYNYEKEVYEENMQKIREWNEKITRQIVNRRKKLGEEFVRQSDKFGLYSPDGINNGDFEVEIREMELQG